MACDKVMCQRWCVTKLCVKDGAWQRWWVTKWCVKGGVSKMAVAKLGVKEGV